MQQWEYRILTVELDWDAYDADSEADYGLTEDGPESPRSFVGG
jgi:hypothetical protein